jgi:hypothetical protein
MASSLPINFALQKMLEFFPLDRWLADRSGRLWLLPNDALPQSVLSTVSAKSDDQHGSALRTVIKGLARSQSPAELRARAHAYLAPSGAGYWVAMELCHWQIEPQGARWLAHGDRLNISDAHFQIIASKLTELFADDKVAVYASGNALSLWIAADIERTQAAWVDEVSGGQMKDQLPAKRWRRYLNEVQMLLSQLPLQQQRAQMGLPAVNSAWFWGDDANANKSTDSLAELSLRFSEAPADPIWRALHHSVSDWQAIDLRRSSLPDCQHALRELKNNDVIVLADGRCCRAQSMSIWRQLARWWQR